MKRGSRDLFLITLLLPSVSRDDLIFRKNQKAVIEHRLCGGYVVPPAPAEGSHVRRLTAERRQTLPRVR